MIIQRPQFCSFEKKTERQVVSWPVKIGAQLKPELYHNICYQTGTTATYTAYGDGRAVKCLGFYLMHSSLTGVRQGAVPMTTLQVIVNKTRRTVQPSSSPRCTV